MNQGAGLRRFKREGTPIAACLKAPAELASPTPSPDTTLLSPRLLFLVALAPLLALAGEGSASPAVNPAPDPAEPLLREAAMHSPVMLEQELYMAQADAFRFRGWRQYMPYISANYQAGYFNLLGAADPNAREGEGKFGGSFSISAYHPIYQWGAIEAEKSFAFARENRARESAVIAWRKLVEDIRAKFLKAVVDKSRITLMERRLEVARVRMERAEKEFKLGRIVEAERSARLLELRTQELELSRSKIALTGLLAQLRSLSGAEKYGVEDLPADLPDVEWDDATLESRLGDYEKIGVEDAPETREAKYAGEALSNQRIMTEARDLPSFNLGVNVSQTPVERQGGFGMQTYLFAGLMGSWNIFDRDTTKENVRSLKIAERLVDTKLTFGRSERKTALHSAIEQLKAARQARDLRRDIVKLRESFVASVKQRVDLGLAQSEELSAAEDALLAARNELINDRATILGAYHAFMAGVLLSPTDQLYTAPTNDR